MPGSGSGRLHVTENCFHLSESLRPTSPCPHLSPEQLEEEGRSPQPSLITPSQERLASAPGGPSTYIKVHSRNSNQTKHSACQGPCLRNNKNTVEPQPSPGLWKLFWQTPVTLPTGGASPSTCPPDWEVDPPPRQGCLCDPSPRSSGL